MTLSKIILDLCSHLPNLLDTHLIHCVTTQTSLFAEEKATEPFNQRHHERNSKIESI